MKHKLILFLFVSFVQLTCSVESVSASEQNNITPAANSSEEKESSLEIVKGIIMLDYEVIPVPGKKSIDLHGIHYLQELNDWLYLGIGLYAPLVYGDYGGFMAFDTTVHVQKKVSTDFFVNAGLSVGGGGGGSSIEKSKELSGTGGFKKSYFGLGYDFGDFSIGINYANFGFKDSQIHHSQFNFFIQEPVSYFIGPYVSAGDEVESGFALPQSGETVLGLELNNIFQIEPKAGVKDTINTVSLQFSHFNSEYQYLFFALDVGYKGLPLYNQAFSGVGYRFSTSPEMNIYGQIGIGSGGYAPSKIDTGAGLLVYPKFSLEYLFSDNLSAALSAGVLVAPTGTSKNMTLGASINYHRSMEMRSQDDTMMTYTGFRFNLFQQTEFNVQISGENHHDINMLTSQFDYILNDYWYFPVQGNIAYNDFLGYPGYGEILFGLGVQNKFSEQGDTQFFFQTLVGANVHGMLFKPSLGFYYSIDSSLAVNGQVGKTISLDKYQLYPVDKRLNANVVGLGLTYRFSLI